MFYYLTVMNENYAHPGLKPGDEEDIIKGMYLLKPAAEATGKPKQARGRSCSARGVILREVIAAAELLQSEWGVVVRRLERAELHRAAARRDGLRTLEPAASRREAAGAVRDAATRQAYRGRSSPRPTT